MTEMVDPNLCWACHGTEMSATKVVTCGICYGTGISPKRLTECLDRALIASTEFLYEIEPEG